jgi:peptidylprolyl isomerase
MKNLLIALLLVLGMTASASAAAPADAENTLYLDLSYGRVVIQLRPDLAPKHVARIKELVRKGFYDGLVFHRVIPGFMAQGGDPTGTGASGSGQNIPAEFSAEPFVRGTVGMARAQDINSADSQFFICFDDAQFLNNKYTVWGNVTSGMEFVDQIRKGEPPMNPDKIVKMQVAADADKTDAGSAGAKQ